MDHKYLMLRQPPHMRSQTDPPEPEKKIKVDHKTDSGFRWGPFNIRGPRPWPLQIQQQGGSVHYPYPTNSLYKISQQISHCDQRWPIIHKGNHFSAFTHARDYKDHCDWWYWDNSLLPQFMNPGAHNPKGDKWWTRLVYRSAFPGLWEGTDQQLRDREQAVNRLLREDTQGQVCDWRQVVQQRKIQRRSGVVMLCTPSEGAVKAWYGRSLGDITAHIQRLCDRRGWQLITRKKPTRRDRQQGNLVVNDLHQHRPSICIGIHSAIGMEVVCEGVPYVSLGAHALGDCTTPWSQFLAGDWPEPDPDCVDRRALCLLAVTRQKKSELMTGTWSMDQLEQRFRPYDDWSLPL